MSKIPAEEWLWRSARAAKSSLSGRRLRARSRSSAALFRQPSRSVFCLMVCVSRGGHNRTGQQQVACLGLTAPSPRRAAKTFTRSHGGRSVAPAGPVDSARAARPDPRAGRAAQGEHQQQLRASSLELSPDWLCVSAREIVSLGGSISPPGSCGLAARASSQPPSSSRAAEAL